MVVLDGDKGYQRYQPTDPGSLTSDPLSAGLRTPTTANSRNHRTKYLHHIPLPLDVLFALRN